MSATRTSTRRQRVLPARYQDADTPSSQTVATTVPRGRKRSRSPVRTSAPNKRTASQQSSTQLDSPESDITFKLTSSPALCTAPPRITVPLDIDVTCVQIPSWIDMTTDYWTVWRHIYDKWHIQAKFANIHAMVHGSTHGEDLAYKELDRLLYIREKLLTDHPDRQDLDLRNRRTVKHVWQFLAKSQDTGYEVAKFNCERVAKEMRWEVSKEDGAMWDQIGAFLMEQGNEGRIYIDPREYYDHYSWCVEDFGQDVSPDALNAFYHQFLRRVDTKESCRLDTIECGDCSVSTDACLCEKMCLLCLPRTETYIPISSESSLPSPPRTPGTQPLPSYFKGKRLSHPPRLKSNITFTDDEAVDLILAFSGVTQTELAARQISRPR